MRHDDLIQNSPEWYKFRESRIGGSDAPIICGVSPYKSARQLWAEKSKQIEVIRSGSSFAQNRGHFLEPIVRGIVGFHLDHTFMPAVYTHDEYNFMMASVDGINDREDEAIEIKHAAKKDHDALNESDQKSIPMKYYPQVQHQLAVSGVKRILYCSYSLNMKKQKDPTKGELKIVPIFRDEEFLNKYIPACIAFYEAVKNGSPPEMVIIRP